MNATNIVPDITSTDKNQSTDKVELLIKGHADYLNYVDNGTFLFEFSEEENRFLPLTQTVLTQIIELIRNNDYNKNLLEIFRCDKALNLKVESFLNRYFNLQEEEVKGNKKLGIALFCIPSEDKGYLTPHYIYQLKYDGSGMLFLTQESLKNIELERELRKILRNFTKNSDQTSKTVAAVDDTFELLSLSLELALILGILSPIPILQVSFLLPKAVNLGKKYLPRFIDSWKKKHSSKSKTEKFSLEETIKEEEDIDGLLVTYEDSNFLINCKNDLSNIRSEAEKFKDKLSMLFDNVESPTDREIGLEYIKREFLPLESKKGAVSSSEAEVTLEYTERLLTSQRSNYGRILLQNITAIQGPPGTGKTYLIAKFCLDRIFERLLKEFKGQLRNEQDYTVLVTSTNNKAVDNVLDKLEEFDEKYTKGFVKTGKYLKGYLRLGSKDRIDRSVQEIINSFFETEDTEEPYQKLSTLKEEINSHLPFVESYKSKEELLVKYRQELEEIEEKIKGINRKIV